MKKVYELFESIEHIFKKITEHPFINELSDGSLDEDKFKFYVIQDAIYLKYFSRGLAILGTKFDNDDIYLSFIEDAKNAIIVERTLHDSFFKEWGLSNEDVYNYEIALISVVYDRPYYESLGAFLPCYWIYLEVGKFLEKKGSKNKLYQKWINTYSSEQFEKTVKNVLNICEIVFEKLKNDEFEKVKNHFIKTSKFEYMFWDMAYKKQTWEV